MLDSETKRHINNARQVLVGKVPDPKAQVEQITTALIYKFMDDMDKESEELGGKAVFFVGDFAKYSWTKLLCKSLSGYERLDLYVRAITEMPKNPKLPSLFRDILKGAFLPYRDTETLNLFLKEINEFTYDHSENLGNAFEYLLSILGSQGDAGQFRTPRHIIDFIIEVIKPQKNETILDPACGTAGFLISAYKHIIKANSKDGLGNLLSPEQKKKIMENIIGYDISPEMVKLSLVNLYLHKFQVPKVYEYDTLTSEDRWKEKFDVIVANPPFMTPKGGIRPHQRFSVKANRSEVLFVDYIAEHLNQNGRAGIIVPEGIIFQSANAYKDLRKMLLESCLWAVVSLPSGIFQPYSGVKTSILFLDRQLAKNRDEILFVKVENDGFGLGAQRRKIEQNNLPEALAVLEEWRKGERDIITSSKIAHVVNKEEITKSGDYNFTGERYKKAVNTAKQKWKMVELGDVLDYEQPTNYIVQSINYNDEYPIPVLTAGKTFILGYTNEKEGVFHKGLPVIIFDDFTTATKFVDFPFKVKSSAMKILHARKEKANICYIFYVMQNISFCCNQHKRFWISEYSKIKIPLPPLSVQQQIVAKIEEKQKAIDHAKQIIELLERERRNFGKLLEKLDCEWVELGDICSFEYGKPLKEENRKGGEFPVFGSNGIVGYHNEYLVEKPFIVVGRKGSAGVVTYSEKNGFPIDTTFYVKIFDQEKTATKFLYLVLQTLQLDKVNVQSGVPGLNRNDAYRIKIPIPTLEIQKQLVAEAEKEQVIIDANKRLIEIMENKINATISEVWNE